MVPNTPAKNPKKKTDKPKPTFGNPKTQVEKPKTPKPNPNPSAYINFSKIVRPELIARYGKTVTFGGYGKILGELWRSIPDSTLDSIKAEHNKGNEEPTTEAAKSVTEDEMDAAKKAVL